MCDKPHFGMETNAFFSTSLTQRASWIQINGLSAAAYKIRFQKGSANLKLQFLANSCKESLTTPVLHGSGRKSDFCSINVYLFY